MTYITKIEKVPAKKVKSRKRGNCECIETWGRPSWAMQALYRFNFDAMPSLKSRNLSIAVLGLWAFCRWYILLYSVTLTFDLWPWTFAVYRLWRDETLYQIWTQPNNSRRRLRFQYLTLIFYDLEHVLVLRSAMGLFSLSFTFDNLWILAFFMLIRYVTL